MECDCTKPPEGQKRGSSFRSKCRRCQVQCKSRAQQRVVVDTGGQVRVVVVLVMMDDDDGCGGLMMRMVTPST